MRLLLMAAIMCVPTRADAPVGRTVFVGDSITVAGAWAPRCSNAVEVAQNSGTTRDLLARVAEVVEARPAHVVILAGVNDIARAIPAEETVRNIQALARATRAEVTVVRVLPVSPAYPRPGYNAKIDALNARLAALDGVRLMTLPASHYRRDGIHFRTGAYDLWQAIYRHRGLC